jgi:glutamate racemase
VNSRYKAIQIPADSYNVAAALIQLKERQLLLVACYEVRAADTEAGRERDLEAVLQTVEATIRAAQQQARTGQLEVLICTDLNRYHVL